MNKTTILSFLLAIVSYLPLSSYPQTQCTLDAPFDDGIVYTNQIFVSPTGNDSSGNGSEASPYRTLSRAARDAEPGAQILLQPGAHQSGQFIDNLKGTADAPVSIKGMVREEVVFSGGSMAFHLTDPEYVVLENFTIEEASGNGINIDDGASYDTPAQHVIIRNVTVRDIGPDGNRDGIKLSGLDHFRIENCLIENPGNGGSGIDMVGCHDGVIAHNRFERIASSGVQAKGGSARILIYANWFENGGSRAINMGGSTGLQFFRPLDAPYEAAHLTAFANVFISGDTPVAFVGSEHCLFAQNVIYLPTRWAARILQETVDERFVPSRNSVFANNAVVIDRSVSTLVNIGGNTQPETFRFANNLFFHTDNPNFSNINLPGTINGTIVQQDPKFVDSSAFNFHLLEDSPIAAQGGDLSTIVDGLPIEIPKLGDFDGSCWDSPPPIGAFSTKTDSGVRSWKVK